MKTFKHFIFGALLVWGATSCIDPFVIEGNGIVNSETRETMSFSEVKTSGNFEVYVTQDDWSEVVVEAEQNILPHIKTTVFGNTLLIDIEGLNTVINHRPMKVFVSTSALRSVKLSGSGSIETDYFEADKMELFVSGSGTIKADVNADQVEAGVSGSGNIFVEGDAYDTKLNISGSGNIFANNMFSDHCNARISGSGNMRVLAEKSLRVEISGSGNVYYTGDPEIEYHISGSGKVINEN